MKKQAFSLEKMTRYGKLIQVAFQKVGAWGEEHFLYKKLQEKIGQKKIKWILIGGALTFVLLFLRACGVYETKKPNIKPPVPVLVASVERADFPLYLSTIGTVTSLDSVTVKTQINGYLKKIFYSEGQMVKKGQILAQIDPQPYEAQLKQAEGQLLRDQAILGNARLDLKRYRILFKEDSISRQTLDTQIYLVKQYEGIVRSDQGLVDAARTNLQYCQIVSDIDGKIGLSQVNEGNFVQTTDATPLAIINTLNPIAVVFPIPEDNLPQVQEQFNNGPLNVEAFDRAGEKILATGRLIAIDSQVNATTGTINLKALFTNEKFHLYPNQFVNIRLKIETLRGMLVIPTAAIQTGSKGTFVYVLNTQDQSVSAKLVTIKTTAEDVAAILGDFQEGQPVVIQGQDKLTEGSIVVPVQKENSFPPQPVRHTSS